MLGAATALLTTRPLLATPRRALRRVGILLDAALPGVEMLRNGTILGAEEAQHTAALLRAELEFAALDARELQASHDAAVRALRAAGIEVVIAGLPAAALGGMAAAAAAADAIVLNVGSDADALRGAGCAAGLFHVRASEHMRRDALEAWAGRRTAAESDARDDAAAVEWHATLRRFGAEQLNDRCSDRFGTPMNAELWLGWMAAKIAAEAAFRAPAAGAAALIAHLRAAGTRFDGHKGRPLSFRAWDQQLRQPLYVVSGGAVAAEVPSAPDVDLDVLGATREQSGCRLAEPAGRSGRS